MSTGLRWALQSLAYAFFLFIHVIISIYYVAWVQACSTQKKSNFASYSSSFFKLNWSSHFFYRREKRGNTHSIWLPSGSSLPSTIRWWANQLYVCWAWKGEKRTLRTLCPGGIFFDPAVNFCREVRSRDQIIREKFLSNSSGDAPSYNA